MVAFLRTGARRLCSAATAALLKPGVAAPVHGPSAGHVKASPAAPLPSTAAALIRAAAPARMHSAAGALIKVAQPAPVAPSRALLRPATSASSLRNAGPRLPSFSRAMSTDGTKDVPIDLDRLKYLEETFDSVEYDELEKMEMDSDLQRQAVFDGWAALPIKTGPSQAVDTKSLGTFLKSALSSFKIDEGDVWFLVTIVGALVVILAALLSKDDQNKTLSERVKKTVREWVERKSPPKKD